VLARSLPLLLERNSAFKFASTIERVAELNTRHTPRGHSGKFITIYPETDAEAVLLAGELHDATVGLAGPRILSDLPYAPGSLVHYRYGAFVEQRRLSNDGFYSWIILDPMGNPVEDRRVGQYLPPSWAECPFPRPESTPPPAQNGGVNQAVLIGTGFLRRGRFGLSTKAGSSRLPDRRYSLENPPISRESSNTQRS